MHWPTVLGSPRAFARHLGRSRDDHRGMTRAAELTDAWRSARTKFGFNTIADVRIEGRSPVRRSGERGGVGSAHGRARIRSGPNCRIKRLFDVVAAGVALVILFVPLVLVAIAVMIDGPGPVLFRQWRGGRDGRRFQIFKFRTMTCAEDGFDVCQARPGDARVTRVGRILRKTSIDELPQLLNVVRGDMSLVGPRPHALVHDAMYSRLITRYAYRHSVRPGMTGWAQVNGCRGETRDLMAMERRVMRDLAYIRHWTFGLDLMIMVMTVREVLHPRKAC